MASLRAPHDGSDANSQASVRVVRVDEEQASEAAWRPSPGAVVLRAMSYEASFRPRRRAGRFRGHRVRDAPGAAAHVRCGLSRRGQRAVHRDQRPGSLHRAEGSTRSGPVRGRADRRADVAPARADRHAHDSHARGAASARAPERGGVSAGRGLVVAPEGVEARLVALGIRPLFGVVVSSFQVPRASRRPTCSWRRRVVSASGPRGVWSSRTPRTVSGARRWPGCAAPSSPPLPMARGADVRLTASLI